MRDHTRAGRRLLRTVAALVAAASLVFAASPWAKAVETDELVIASSTSLVAGQRVQSYTVTVTNLGDAPRSIIVPDTAPLGARVLAVDATEGSYEARMWTIPGLRPGMTAGLTLLAL